MPEERTGHERWRNDIESIYAELTDGWRRQLRVSELVYAAAERFPGLLPTRAAIDAERQLCQKDKQGLEIEQGVFIWCTAGTPDQEPSLLSSRISSLLQVPN